MMEFDSSVINRQSLHKNMNQIYCPFLFFIAFRRNNYNSISIENLCNQKSQELFLVSNGDELCFYYLNHSLKGQDSELQFI